MEGVDYWLSAAEKWLDLAADIDEKRNLWLQR